MDISIDNKYQQVLLEALSDYQYKISLELNKMKGQAMSNRRKELTKKQKLVEEVQSHLSID